MVHATAPAAELREEVDRAGYYPQLVNDSIEAALGGEEVNSFFVQQETTFDQDEVRRHITVLALTPTRLIIGHTDDAEEESEDGQEELSMATTSTETVALHQIKSVVVSSAVADPQNYRPSQSPTEVTVTVGWGSMSRVDLAPATCGDPACEVDHGYTGATAVDDLPLRVSSAADGGEAVGRMLAFAATLTRAVANAR